MSLSVKNINIQITFLFCIFLCLIVAFDKTGNVFLSVLFIILHELSHIIAMRLCGVKIKKVAFEAFGIYIEKDDYSPKYTQNLFILISGCAFNFFACFAFFALFLFWRNKIFLKSALINFSLCVFNALPVKNLDGGDALYLLLSELKLVKNPLTTVKIISFITCLCLFAAGIILCVKVRLNPSLIIVSLYLLFSLFIGS